MKLLVKVNGNWGLGLRNMKVPTLNLSGRRLKDQIKKYIMSVTFEK